MKIAEIYTLAQALAQEKASQVLTFAQSIRGELGSSRSAYLPERLLLLQAGVLVLPGVVD